MNGILFDCGVKELDLSSWNASNFEDMSPIFFICPKLHKLDLSNFKTPNLKMGEMMFGEDAIYDLDIRNLESSKKGTHMLFERSLIYKITVEPKCTDTFPDFNAINRPFEEDGIMYIPTSNL